MKKLLFLVLFVSAILTSCQKDEIEIEPISQQVETDPTWIKYPSNNIPDSLEEALVLKSGRYPSTSYVVPTLNNYQSPPSKTVKYENITYYGGPFQFCAASVSGNNITFKLKRSDGLKFPKGSVLTIKKGNAGGTTVTSKKLTSASSSVSLTVSESVTWNNKGSSTSNSKNYNNYVAAWYNPDSKLNFYTNPERVIAVPTGWGATLPGLNFVNVYSNGWGGFRSTDYLRDPISNCQKYQCVEFINRYYRQVYHLDIGNSNANDYWYNYKKHSLNIRILNGGEIPLQGDIIYLESSSSWHVGIVNGINPTNGFLRIFNENWGQKEEKGNFCKSYFELTITKTSTGYKVGGILGYTTLGWLRL